MRGRTLFKKEIVAEFFAPHRPNGAVLILCSGIPGVPEKDAVLEYFGRRGFFVIFPRYRGTWESGGTFLRRSPHHDILDVISELPRGFSDLWTGQKVTVNSKKLFVMGSSFGGPAAILASRDPRVTKAVAISPVIDWRVDSKDEPLDRLGRFLKGGYGGAYRFSQKSWDRLLRGGFYNPADETDSIDRHKLLVFHAKDDTIVPYGPTRKFCRETTVRIITFPRGGHFGLSESILPRFSSPIGAFLRA